MIPDTAVVIATEFRLDMTDVQVAHLLFSNGWTPLWWVRKSADHDPGDEDRK